MTHAADPLPFSRRVRQVFEVSPAILPADFADAFRVLPATDPKPGPWRTSWTEFWREPMNAFAGADAEEIVLVAGAQTGKSRVLENLVAWVACNDPVDMLYVLPRETDVRHVGQSRIAPMIHESPQIARQLSGEVQSTTSDVTFASCRLYLVAANSPAGLAQKSCAVVFLDEIGKFPAGGSGAMKREGSPVDLARQRSNAFEGRRKIVAASSPTTRSHGVWIEFERSDMRRFHLPCHACGTFQVLQWSNVRYVEDLLDRVADADQDRSALAWYCCESCGAHWSDTQKRDATKAGVWVPDGGFVEDGRAVGGVVRNVRGYHVSGLLSPVRSFADFAQRWVRAQGNRHKLGTFFRSDLGEPWDEAEKVWSFTAPTEADEGHALGELPPEAVAAGARLFVGVDYGKHVQHWVALAVAPGLEAWVLEYGETAQLPELSGVFDRSYVREVDRGTGASLDVLRAGIDAGYRPDLVCPFVAAAGGRVFAVRGKDKLANGRLWISRALDDYPGARLITFDVQQLKDTVAQRQETGAWHEPRDTCDTWRTHWQNEQKTENDAGAEVWRPRYQGAATHYLDAAVYALGLAHMAGLWKHENESTAQRRARDIRARARLQRLSTAAATGAATTRTTGSRSATVYTGARQTNRQPNVLQSARDRRQARKPFGGRRRR